MKQGSDRSMSDDAEHGYTAKNHKRHFVTHNYHDHSDDVDAEKLQTEGARLGGVSYSTQDGSNGGGKHKSANSSENKQRGGVNMPFPEKLHEMLDKIEQDGFASIISWQSHGRAFAVHKQKEFVDIIMPRYFRQSKISSFQRQLNLYGFCRLTRGRDKGAYYHELFLRDRIFLCRKMTRTRIKGTGIKASSSPDSEPNFYTMKHCFVADRNMAVMQLPWAVAASAHHLQQQQQQQVTMLSPQGQQLDSSAAIITSAMPVDWQHLEGQGQSGPSSCHSRSSSVALHANTALHPGAARANLGEPLVGVERPHAHASFLSQNSELLFGNGGLHASAALKNTFDDLAVSQCGGQSDANNALTFDTKMAPQDQNILHAAALAAFSNCLMPVSAPQQPQDMSSISARLLDPLILRRIHEHAAASASKKSGAQEEALKKAPRRSDHEGPDSARMAAGAAQLMNHAQVAAPAVQPRAQEDSSALQFSASAAIVPLDYSPRTSAAVLNGPPQQEEEPLLQLIAMPFPGGTLRRSNAEGARRVRAGDSLPAPAVIERRQLGARQPQLVRDVYFGLRRVSFMNLEDDVSYHDAERLDEEAMDNFFADFEDTEISELLSVIQRHDNDEVLGGALEHMMDTL
jgi:hypothetical protein